MRGRWTSSVIFLAACVGFTGCKTGQNMNPFLALGRKKATDPLSSPTPSAVASTPPSASYGTASASPPPVAPPSYTATTNTPPASPYTSSIPATPPSTTVTSQPVGYTANDNSRSYGNTTTGVATPTNGSLPQAGAYASPYAASAATSSNVPAVESPGAAAGVMTSSPPAATAAGRSGYRSDSNPASSSFEAANTHTDAAQRPSNDWTSASAPQANSSNSEIPPMPPTTVASQRADARLAEAPKRGYRSEGEYQPGRTSYDPGNTNYNPPGAAEYNVPSQTSMNTIPPVDRPTFQQRTDPMYRPGGTTEYLPNSARTQGANTTRSANSNVSPAAYNSGDPQNCPGGICPDRRYVDPIGTSAP